MALRQLSRTQKSRAKPGVSYPSTVDPGSPWQHPAELRHAPQTKSRFLRSSKEPTVTRTHFTVMTYLGCHALCKQTKSTTLQLRHLSLTTSWSVLSNHKIITWSHTALEGRADLSFLSTPSFKIARTSGGALMSSSSVASKDLSGKLQRTTE